MSLSACSTQGEVNNDDALKNDIVKPTIGVNNTSDDNFVENGDSFSLEDLQHAKETPTSEFEYELVDGGVVITKYEGDSSIIVIPEYIEENAVLAIGETAFANNTSIKGLKLSNSVIKIEKNAFANCSELELFISGTALKEINDYAFNGCNNMKDVVLNEGLERLELSCLNSESLMKIEVPSSVTYFNGPFCLFDKKTRVIIAEKGSPAETFANESGYSFQEK